MINAKLDTSSLMNNVLLGIAPAAIVSVGFFGLGPLLNMVLCVLTALASEALINTLRGRPPTQSWADRSAMVAALLLALALPPLAPVWLPIIATGFAIIIGKQLYGGLGQNPFNPAMVGYAAALIAFPLEMSLWPQSMQESGLGLSSVFSAYAEIPWDAISSATVLDANNTALRAGQALPDIALVQQPSTWIALAWAAGGAWLLYRGIISWHIPVGMLAAVSVFSGVFYVLDPSQYSAPLTHLLAGATLAGAFFIATDPVSAPAHRNAKLLYGVCIGCLAYVIRTWGSFPDSVAFAVLLMNLCAPTLDHLWRGRR